MGNERKLRLIQVAKEFKVGLNTVTDFLQKKGIKSDGSPNTLVDAETYAVLEKEFGANRSAASARDSIRERISLKQTTVTLEEARKQEREEEKEVVIKSNVISVKDEIQQPKFLGKIDLSPKPKAAPAPQPKPAPEAVKPAPQPAAPAPQPDPAQGMAQPQQPAPGAYPYPPQGQPAYPGYGYQNQYAAYGAYPPPVPPVNIQNAQLHQFDAMDFGLPTDQQDNLKLLMGVPLEISVEIGTAKRKVKDILEFTQGTIIELERQAGAPVDVVVNGNLIARGDVVVIDDNFAVRITEIVKSKFMDSLGKE